jgi:hypothetical protein
VVYSPALGPLAETAATLGVRVISDLDQPPWTPDVIHGQHHIELMTALLRFPLVPVIGVSIGSIPWQERLPRHPRVVRYVAPSLPTRNRLIDECGIPSEDIEIVPLFVDLDRFKLRAPLPTVPRRALVFSNTASDATYLGPIRAACERWNIELDVIGAASGRVDREPEHALPQYDIVFAVATSAAQALAVGCATILVDPSGVGGMVTSDRFEYLRDRSFGHTALTETITIDAIATQVARYDPPDAARVGARVRAEQSLTLTVEKYLDLYQLAIQSSSAWTDDISTRMSAEAEANAAYLAHVGAIVGLLLDRTNEAASVARQLDDLRVQHESLLRDLEAVVSSRTWRARGAILRLPRVQRAYESINRRITRLHEELMRDDS